MMPCATLTAMPMSVSTLTLVLALGAQSAPAPATAPAPPPATAPTSPPVPGGPAPRKNAEPFAPPFIPNAGAQPTPPQALQGRSPPAYIAGARQWVVEPGTSWRLFADKILPGDEILFTAWFHIPQDFVGLNGTAERPIFIRSRDEKPAAIACERNGFTFQRCKHVIVENILFFNAVDAGVLVDGAPVAGADPASPVGAPAPSGWNSDLTIRHCTFAGTRDQPDQDAVRVRNTNGVIVDSIRVEGWNDAAVEIDSSRRVLVRGLMTAPPAGVTPKRGVAVLGPSSDISLTGCSFNASIAKGVQVGTPGAPNENGVPPVAPVERMRIDRCLFDRTETSIELANVRDLGIGRVSFIEPLHAIYAIPEDAGVVERVVIEYCLATWMPGGLQKFSPHTTRIPATAITLGDNLWYSAELPTAFEVIGQPYGFQAMGQTTSVDPRVDPMSLRPQSADGVRYGVFSIAHTTGSGAPVQVPDQPPAAKQPAQTSPANPRPQPTPGG